MMGELVKNDHEKLSSDDQEYIDIMKTQHCFAVALVKGIKTCLHLTLVLGAETSQLVVAI